MNDVTSNVARNLSKIRAERGYSRREVLELLKSEGIEINPTSFRRMEAGSQPLRIGEVVDFAKIYGVAVQELIDSPDAKSDRSDSLIEVEGIEQFALRQLSDTILPIRKRQERLAELSDEPKAKLVDRRINAVLGHLYDAIAEMGKSYE